MNSYIFFRKVHRYLVLVTIVTSFFMLFTGILLKYPRITNVVPVNLVYIRNLHNVASPLFAGILLLMLVTGSVMYFYPLLRKKTKV